MDFDKTLQDVLSRPKDAIRYTLSESIERALAGKAYLQTDDHMFVPEWYAQSQECELELAEPFHNQVRSGWDGTHRSRYDFLQNGAYRVNWRGHQLLLIVLTTREGHCDEVRRYLVGETPEIVDSFFKEVCLWCSEIRSEILVFADAYWRKDELLYNAIKGTSFDEIVLRGDLKDQIRRDIARFLTSREAYERYRIPWKRGLLFLGPPGNGKTQMVKAIANEVGIPVLYVKSFKSEYRNDHHAIHEAFKRARQAAPCLFVLEDLDTLVDEGNRSFFLNEMDGFASNTGLITLATANHPERLDPAILDRPSRFDRKFVFDLPGRNERVAYLNVWNAKLESELRLSESGIERVAEATEEFSYAYLKELVLSAMMSWMEDGSNGTLEPQMLELAPVLRSHMKSGLDAFPGIPIGDEDDEEDGPFREFSSAELSG